MYRNQQSLQVRRARLAQPGSALGGADKFALGRGRNVHFEQRFHFTEAADVAGEMKTQICGDARA